MSERTWQDYVSGHTEAEIAMITAFREFTTDLPESSERVNASEIRFMRERTYAVAYLKSKRLEVAIDLLRAVEHPLLRDSFHTTKKVVTHRLTIDSADQVDARIGELVAEAYETVGPGTR